MFMTTMAIVLAAFFGASLVSACFLFLSRNRLLKKVRNLRALACKDKRINEELNDNLDNLIEANSFENVCYILRYENNRVDVLRQCLINGRVYHTFIKAFNDEDMEFNQLEAMELCEILNAK